MRINTKCLENSRIVYTFAETQTYTLRKSYQWKSYQKSCKKISEDIQFLHKNHHTTEQERFNVFLAMRSKNDEVNLHSRIIASLLDPSAPHEMKKTPLRLFLKIVGIKDSIADEANLKIVPNYRNKSEWNEMDILITTNKHAILLENKIDAYDSNKENDITLNNGRKLLKGQLERYYDILIKEGTEDIIYDERDIFVLYLTKDGHMPSEVSTGSDRKKPIYPRLRDKVICINYGVHIKQWLSLLLEEKTSDYVKTLIKQYLDTIKNMSEILSEKDRKKIVNSIGNLSDEERSVLLQIFSKEKDICLQNAIEFFNEVIKMSKTKRLCIESVDCSKNEESTDCSQWNEIISYGINRIIVQNKKECVLLVFRSKSGAKLYLGFGEHDPVYISIYYRYTNSTTRREKTMPQEVIDHLLNNEYT